MCYCILSFTLIIIYINLYVIILFVILISSAFDVIQENSKICQESDAKSDEINFSS